ncbi:hypothetical protein FB451DRAFT_1393798 [Mycena latifolia]|nr:hypothetical protein FB451DRAFT_1393798 [Mycena latifolia]
MTAGEREYVIPRLALLPGTEHKDPSRLQLPQSSSLTTVHTGGSIHDYGKSTFFSIFLHFHTPKRVAGVDAVLPLVSIHSLGPEQGTSRAAAGIRRSNAVASDVGGRRLVGFEMPLAAFVEPADLRCTPHASLAQLCTGVGLHSRCCTSRRRMLYACMRTCAFSHAAPRTAVHPVGVLQCCDSCISRWSSRASRLPPMSRAAVPPAAPAPPADVCKRPVPHTAVAVPRAGTPGGLRVAHLRCNQRGHTRAYPSHACASRSYTRARPSRGIYTSLHGLHLHLPPRLRFLRLDGCTLRGLARLYFALLNAPPRRRLLHLTRIYVCRRLTRLYAAYGRLYLRLARLRLAGTPPAPVRAAAPRATLLLLYGADDRSMA